MNILPEEVANYVNHLGEKASAAARALATASTQHKNEALRNAAAYIRAEKEAILKANALDVANARHKGQTDAFIDRLMLDDERIDNMATAMEMVAEREDPVGRTLEEMDRPNGLRIERVAVPIGVIGMIFESRPNVAADASALCLKSGNAVILRSGSESFHTVGVIVDCIKKGVSLAGLPTDGVQVVDTTERSAVTHLLECSDHIDLIIPRGGKGLVKLVKEKSAVPTLEHLDGNCHTYIHADADLDKAEAVVRNAKLRRTGICGATESLVIDKEIAAEALPRLLDSMPECEFRGDAASIAIDSRISKADDDDWATEYLDSILSVKVVQSLGEALSFVDKHSSKHTDAIVTENNATADAFMATIDSAVVMHNASTQFSDGGEFGMGAEIGIATGKIHARGPVGLDQLTTFKYKVHGNGHTRP